MKPNRMEPNLSKMSIVLILFLLLVPMIFTINQCPTENCLVCDMDSIICPDVNLLQVPMVSPFVVYLNLSRNQIGELTQKSFAHLPLLEELDLCCNQIKMIPDRVFAGLGSLRILFLNDNQITDIARYGFRNLDQLQQLSLVSNPILYLDGRIFKELFKLKHLTLFSPVDNDLHRICNCNSSSLELCSRFPSSNLSFQNDCFSILDFDADKMSMKRKSKYNHYKTTNRVFVPIVSTTTISKNTTTTTTKRPEHKIFQPQPHFRSKSPTFIFKNGSAPILTSVPESIYRVKLGSEIRLMCEAVGYPKPNIKWIRFGRTISFNSTFYLERILPEDEGVYECAARNVNGRATRDVRIIIIGSFSPNSRLNDSRDLIEEIIFASRRNETVPIGDLFTNIAEDVAKFVDLYRLVMAYSDNRTDFQAPDLTSKNMLTPVQATVMNNYTGCIAGARFETFNCHQKDYDRYYSITGICNNRLHAVWGASLEPFLRLLPAQYEDGFVKPIGWFNDQIYSNGYRKPNPRKVTQELLSTEDITNDPKYNHLLMQFGQFLDHDITFAGLADNRNLLEMDKMDCERMCNEYVEPCYSIRFTDDRQRGCIEFKRSAEYCGSGFSSVVFGKLHKREQVNLLTSFIDGSQIYGSTTDIVSFLRSPIQMDDGLLNVTIVEGRMYLPQHNQHISINMDCQPEPETFTEECFLAGDHRANEHLGLLVFHNLWLRQHNFLAQKLKSLNPEWSRDRVFYETRKIVAAQLQIITYREWLPPILGQKGMKMLGDYRGYNPNIDPSISNAFATAAMRFGHTLVNKNLIKELFQYKRMKTNETRLHRAFFKPDLLYRKNMTDSVIFGLLMTPLKETRPEQAITDELTERLFKLSRYTPLDLASINIQRGRDHGLPGYNEWRKFCGLRKAQTFDDLKYEIQNKEIRKKLEKLYGHPDNVDLYVAGILEKSEPDSKIGPTFRCLVVDQFRRLRDGDRLFYQNPNSFTEEQRRELEKTTLSKVICDNSDDTRKIVPNAFLLPTMRNDQNGWIDCQRLPDLDLTKWMSLDFTEQQREIRF